MSRGIIIFGSAGAGKTTLGKIVADKLNFQWADSLPCKVLHLSGDEDLNKNMEIIVNEYI